ncbi:hypothetical protein K227x_23220 [Rubripirellula lacrimiformis]|uniref:Uncharacterized protein n=1 Tax=Rubripirellula lacrimiformis TaxID=1930273 RepID=A0A517N9X3_9BACT|nr:iron ABC transporter permease [Rubripirellula lacrimiformis]QDT03936.1 hypothetical protein K227x_23220 [Rubripirellula lacrimiformis]
MSQEARSIGLEAYVHAKVRCHERPIDSPLISGARAGGFLYFIASLLFYYLANVYSSLQIGGYYLKEPTKVLFWITIGGAFFGAAVFWILSITVARLRVTFDGARVGFLVGFFVGAGLGAALSISTSLAANPWQIEAVLTLQAGEFNGAAIRAGSMFAVVGAFVGAIRSRPIALPNDTQVPRFLDRNQRARTFVFPNSQWERSTQLVDRERFQFGLGRILVLTAVIALAIAIPRMMYVRLMSIPVVAHYAGAEVLIPFFVSVLIFVTPYVVWVTFRGPQAFTSLATALGRWIHFRKISRPPGGRNRFPD